MKIIFLNTLFLISVTCIGAQEPSLKIVVDKNLTVIFPTTIDSFEVEKTKIYNSTSEKVQFSVSKYTSAIIDKSKVEFDSSLSTFRKSIDSFSKSLYAIKFYQDSVLGGTKGVYAILDSSITEAPIKKMHIFYTTKDSFTYTFYAKLYRRNDENVEKEVNKFYNSLKFSENYYNNLLDTIYDVPRNKIPGRIFGIVVTIIILSYLMYSLITRKTVI